MKNTFKEHMTRETIAGDRLQKKGNTACKKSHK